MSDLGTLRKGKVGGGRATTARRAPVRANASDGDFITRIQLALDLTPKQLANALDVPYDWVVNRHGTRAEQSSAVTDPFWSKLQAYVNERLAGCLAVKDELDRKIRNDTRRHNERQAQIRNRS